VDGGLSASIGEPRGSEELAMAIDAVVPGGQARPIGLDSPL
jgi:hypothetical protein